MTRPGSSSAAPSQLLQHCRRRHHHRYPHHGQGPQALAFRTTTTAATTAAAARPAAAPSSPPPDRGACKLTNRRLIAVQGLDATNFLHGITTNSIDPGQRTALYSAFLTAQGRVLNDVFIYPDATRPLTSSPAADADAPRYLIEVDAAEAASLQAHLRRHKLRARLLIRLLDAGSWNVWSVWGDGDGGWGPGQRDADSDHHHAAIGGLDQRAPGMGYRVVLARDERPRAEVEESALETYTYRRMTLGVAEGQAEIVRETALPQESNLDYMGALNFHKGCYVGQELTIRTHHMGLVRKRILPVRLSPTKPSPDQSLPPPGTPIVRVGDGSSSSSSSSSSPDTEAPLPPRSSTRLPSPGKFLRGTHDVGLALCRLDIMTDLNLIELEDGRSRRQHEMVQSTYDPGQRFAALWISDGSTVVDGRVGVRAVVPEWHLQRDWRERTGW
ncbi:MAG: ccr4 associated factor [Phylliscum demangeonii]|nr:MAG: ccr4 associated factor [Phylliscum demangeonii]